MLLVIAIIVATVLFIMHRWLGASNVAVMNMNKDSRITKDPMMLTHHPNCNFWLNAKCICYVSWVRDMQKELEKYREQDKKLSEDGDG